MSADQFIITSIFNHVLASTEHLSQRARVAVIICIHVSSRIIIDLDYFLGNPGEMKDKNIIELDLSRSKSEGFPLNLLRTGANSQILMIPFLYARYVTSSPSLFCGNA